jgi:hypothetical protein
MSAMPPDGSGSGDVGQDVLLQLSTWLGSILDDLLRLMADAEAGPAVMAELGWEGTLPVLPAQLLSRIDDQAQGGAGTRTREAEEFGEVLLALGAFGDALVAAASAESSGVSAAELIADFLDIVIAGRMRREHPVVWSTLRLLNLLNDDGAQLANLANLVGDARTYLSGLVQGPGYAQAFADYSAAILGALGTATTFLPAKGRHGHDATSFRAEALYGWEPAGPDDHPNLMQILGRTLTVRLDGQVASTSSTPAAEEVIDLTLTLVPQEHNNGSWGLFVRVAGATAFSIPLGRPKPPDPITHEPTPTGWQLTIAATDGVAVEMLFGDGGFIRGAGSGFSASVAIERPDDVPGSWVIGKSDGSHVEIQHGRVAATLSTDDQGTLFDVGVRADHVILNIEIGQDSFLRAVLPPSIRMDSRIGLGVNTRRGFYLDGGVALVVDLPADIVVGKAGVLDLKLQGLHLRLGIGTTPSGPKSGESAQFSVGFTVDAAVEIAGGAFVATVAGIGVAYSLTQVAGDPAAGGGGTAGRWQPRLTPVPPDGLGVVIKAGPVAGGGYIGYDRDRGEYSGVLQVHVGAVGAGFDVTALALLDTKIPGREGDWALLAIVAVQWKPAPNVLGFQLTGFGVVVGFNHTLDTDAIAAGLRTKVLDAILFPPDPVAQAPHIFAVWRQTMPVSPGSTVVGLMLQFSWGEGGLCSLDIALLFSFDPFQIVVLGSLRLSAPSQDVGLVRLRSDLLGRMRFDPVDVLIQSELSDSRLGTFIVSGGVVILVRGGSESAYVLSAGGFNPHFTPPSNVPVAERLCVDISGSDNPRLRLEAYVALTSQSFQFGARAQLHAAAGPLTIDGWLGLDALIQWLPRFRFSVEISAGLSLSYDGSPVLEVSIDVLLEGPGPWHVKGYASLSLLFFTLSLPIDASWGEDAGPTAQTAQPLQLVHDALSAPGAWSAAAPPGSSGVVLRGVSGVAVPAHPLAVITARQGVVPLGMQITHVGNQPLAAATTVDITTLTLAGAPATDNLPVTEEFAAGQFIDLSDDQALSRPSFEPMRAGLSAGSSSIDTGNATAVATSYKTVAVDGASATRRPKYWILELDHADAVLRPPQVPLARPRPTRLSIVPDTVRTVAGSTDAGQTWTLAAQQAGAARLLDAVGIAGGA